MKKAKHLNKLIGLTGGIASGKSTVTEMLSQLGAHIIDADKISRDLVKPSTPAYGKILRTFGPDFLEKGIMDAPIDRKKLSRRVFNDPHELKKLNEILEQAIITTAFKIFASLVLNDRNRIYIYDAATIFEAGADKHLYKTIVVYVPEEIQIQRLIKRDGITKKEATQMILSQIPIEEKKGKADFIIYNNQSLKETKMQVLSTYRKLQELCNR